jgi:hypothetical protein
VAEAAGPEGSEIYKPGDAAAAGFSGPKANLYVVRKVGMFPDVCESLAAGHLKRGDQVRRVTCCPATGARLLTAAAAPPRFHILSQGALPLCLFALT